MRHSRPVPAAEAPDDPMAPVRKAVTEVDRRRRIAVLHEFGMEPVLDPNGEVVGFSQPMEANPERDEPLFTRPDEWWIAKLGMRRGMTAAAADRPTRARTLAHLGRLTARERQHLEYLATATNPIDTVRPTTKAITSADAQAALAAAKDAQQ